MTSAPIQEMASMLSGINTGSSFPKVPETKENFDSVLGNVKNLDYSMNNSFLNDNNLVRENDSIEIKESVNSSHSESINSKLNDSKETSNDVSRDDISSKLQKAKDNSEIDDSNDANNEKAVSLVSKKILKEVADELDISLEELEEIMQNLGLTASSLVNPQNVSLLAVNVMADGDMTALLTDENLLGTVLDINSYITTTLEDVSKELGISVDEFTKIFEELDSVEISDADSSMTVSENLSDDVINISDLKNSDDNTVDELDLTVYQKQNEISSDEMILKNEDDSESGFSENDSELSKKQMDKNDFESKTVGFSNDNSSFNANMNINPEVSVNEELYGTSSTQNDIIDQVNEYLKANIKTVNDTVEMQLNPENLGTVNVSIAAKEGNVTAHFTTQNELVRAALESQIAILKDNLESQGVKVSAVSVTVESHEFERNLEQNSGRNDAEAEEENRLRKATRKLNLNDILADDNIEGFEDLEEDEIVTAKMMQADGNSMDYKV